VDAGVLQEAGKKLETYQTRPQEPAGSRDHSREVAKRWQSSSGCRGLSRGAGIKKPLNFLDNLAERDGFELPVPVLELPDGSSR
jgi:hypothetical protein